MKELEYYITVFSSFLKDRNSKKNKDNFLKLCTNIFTNLGYKTEIEEYNDRLKSRNLIIGNSNAKTTIMAAYDVPNRLIINRPYYVNDMIKIKKTEANNMFAVLSILLVVIVLSSLLLYLTRFAGVYRYLLVVVIIILLYLLYRVLFSSSKTNYAMDGALSVIYAYADKVKDDNTKYCFVMCDNSSMNYWGIRLFLKKHKTNDPIIIDKLGSGEIIEIRSNGKKSSDVLSQKSTIIAKGRREGDSIIIDNVRNGKSSIINKKDLSIILEKIEKISKSK